MRNQLLFLFFSVSTLFFISCDKKSGDPFTINGTITGAENKKIILETMTFPEAGQPKYTIIDTVTADKEGKFTIKNHLPERMTCRLTVAGADQNYYVVSLQNEEMELTANVCHAHERLYHGIKSCRK